jgi:16S rRNA (adenine1518-N6/adenine1519-N6)-dimethyltransferase
MEKVRAKKHLGQHFLTNKDVASRIADLTATAGIHQWLEIGPGTGVLTEYLLKKNIQLTAAEIDTESVQYLKRNYPELHVLEGDFLKLESFWKSDASFGVIGNFPYNISSQIVFKILEHVHQIPHWAGMFQWEVAQRLAAKPHTKAYGILSVLVQAYYTVEIAFKVKPGNFNPPPKVDSGVVDCQRLTLDLGVDKQAFFKVVKTAFNQRRKTLSNALKPFKLDKELTQSHQLFKLRAENLTVEDFLALTQLVVKHGSI